MRFREVERFVLGQTFKSMPSHRSADGEPTKDSFLGFYLSSALKEQVEERAEELGVSISELARRRLSGDDEAAGQTAATT